MGEQAPAGWYPDGQGNERYWDGSAWTEQFRQSGGFAGYSAERTAPKQSALSKLKKAATDMHAERQSAKEDSARKQAEYAQAAGSLLTSGVFGASTVEIYRGGYVRVAVPPNNGAQVATVTKKTPYEKLLSIKFTEPATGSSTEGPSALEGAMGPAMARLAKGGAGLMKASAPGLAVAGLSHLAGAEGRRAFLTIATDAQIHTLSNETHNGLMAKANKAHNAVGLALAAAGNSVLGVAEEVAVGDAPTEPEPSSAPPTAAANPQNAGPPTFAEKVRELAELRNEGVLSDEEFAAAKAKLLNEL